MTLPSMVPRALAETRLLRVDIAPQINGWIGLLAGPPMVQFFEELKTHPNVPFVLSGEGITEIIPEELQ